MKIGLQYNKRDFFAVQKSLKECPSNEDLINIWNDTIGVAKEVFDNILKELKATIQKYLDNDVYVRIDERTRPYLLYDLIWKETCSGFSKTIELEQLEYTNDFYRLINDEHTLDDILQFIYAFLEHFRTLKKELYEKYKKVLEKIKKHSDGDYLI
ncbi:Plasmodium exported protein (PHIST), unknown, putative [Plasmodium gaboni]|uniref:Plasmodium RESA N-terminal domain-containing protein n=1 Tax=Plasmodium gaboni TaxID=647221 RepID=A0ABY0KVZ7_9APIC|nr:Plasmodium exported protein (PHIST), unknown, putative [Plasmodium gaboni]